MAAPMKMLSLRSLLQKSSFTATANPLCRCLSLTSVNRAGAEWRNKFGLASNPNQRGRLSAEYPDYSYCDGRPTPIPTALARKKGTQMKYATSVLQGLQEVDALKYQHQQKLQQQRTDNQAIIDSKLKPKGAKMKS